MTEQKKKRAKAEKKTPHKSARRKTRSDRLEIEALRAELDLPLEGSRKSDDSPDSASASSGNDDI